MAYDLGNPAVIKAERLPLCLRTLPRRLQWPFTSALS